MFVSLTYGYLLSPVRIVTLWLYGEGGVTIRARNLRPALGDSGIVLERSAAFSLAIILELRGRTCGSQTLVVC
eukprot:999060-Prorocentrum_minimum.AAC.1